MMLTVGVVNIWRRWLPRLPRKPDSVAAVLTYVCCSRMVGDFEGVEGLSVRERDGRIRRLGKRYRYFVRKAEDGVLRRTVDEMGGANADADVRVEKEVRVERDHDNNERAGLLA